MALHDLERRRQPLPMTLCRNINCARPQGDNVLGLCQFWYDVTESRSQE